MSFEQYEHERQEINFTPPPRFLFYAFPMCGHFTQSSPTASVAQRFKVDTQRVLVQDWQPRYNLAPSQSAMVVRTGSDGARQLEAMSWGFVPGWAKDLQGMPRPINARAETVESKSMFRGAFRSHRCLIPCDGFYEWQATSGGKQPHFIRMQLVSTK